MAKAKPKKVKHKPKQEIVVVPPKKKKRGQPTKFSEAMMQKLLSFAVVGKHDRDMAALVGVTQRTIDNWKKNHPDFFQSLKKAKAIADESVEASLYERAKGFRVKAVKFLVVNGEIRREEYEEVYPPDTTAAIFWLKNRQRTKWRDVSGREFSGSNGGPIDMPIRINVNLPANGYEAPQVEATKQNEGEGK